MCGIAGFMLSGTGIAAPEGVLRAMTSSLRHRGPDGFGHWFDTQEGVALGHRRLAILDLTEAGHQPMSSAGRRFMMIFNGEVYNFQILRSELESRGANFRGHSDTEVMLAAFEQWGVEAATRRFIGMFAIAVWDSVDRVLYLIRDRLGKKPVYYGMVRGSLVFGSELKALRQFPGFEARVDREALTLFLRHNYVPGPWSIYEGIHKLPPGSLMQIRQTSNGPRLSKPLPYWSAAEVFERSQPRAALSDEEALEQFEQLLCDAVRLRMIADVPLGAFLSGGIDSSLVVALMQKLSSQPVRTFTIGFHEGLYDEAPYARAVARHLGTEHTEVYLTAADARNVIPRLPSMFDEPFADSSQIPTFLVSEATRRRVTVALSGDGGDELFFGYLRYFRWCRLWSNLHRFPRRARRALAHSLMSVPVHHWNTMLRPVSKILSARLRWDSPGDKLHKFAEVLRTEDPGLAYLRLVSHWTEPSDIVIGGREPATLLNRGGGPTDQVAFMHQMMKLDVLTYLPDDILVKVDRASMAVSLETRAPLLDHRVVEFAAGLPVVLKYRNREGKWLVRRALSRHVPERLTDRPKMGFGVPIDNWLRGPLREWAEDLLDESKLRREGFFNAEPIRKLWTEHLARRREAHYLLWDIILFQAWIQEERARQALRAA